MQYDETKEEKNIKSDKNIDEKIEISKEIKNIKETEIEIEKDKRTKSKRKKEVENNKKTKNIFSRFFSVIVVIITLIIITFNLLIIVQTKVLKKNYANIFGYTILSVKSGSMQNEIMIDDIVIVKILEDPNNDNKENIENLKNNIEVNDIITFLRENYLITHRVIKKNQDDLITQGDANNAADAPVNYKDIVGKVVKVIPNIGIWKKVFSEKSVLIPLLSGTILLVIAFMIDDSEETKKDEYGKSKQKIQKGKRFKK